MEIVRRQYVARPGQLALGIYVCLAEFRLVHIDASLPVAVPQHLAPMASAGVERTAVVEDYSLYLTFVYIHGF